MELRFIVCQKAIQVTYKIKTEQITKDTCNYYLVNEAKNEGVGILSPLVTRAPGIVGVAAKDVSRVCPDNDKSAPDAGAPVVQRVRAEAVPGRLEQEIPLLVLVELAQPHQVVRLGEALQNFRIFKSRHSLVLVNNSIHKKKLSKLLESLVLRLWLLLLLFLKCSHFYYASKKQIQIYTARSEDLNK